MRRLRLFSGALVVAVTFVAFPAVASAEFFLAFWLYNGTEAQNQLNWELNGELSFEDNKVPVIGKAKVLCSAFFVGWAGPNSSARVSELLNLSGEGISTADLMQLPLECTSLAGCEKNSNVLVWPFGYPKEAEVVYELETGTGLASFMILILGKTGWHISECLVLGVPQEDLCESATGAAGLLSLEGTTLLRTYSAEATSLAGLEPATCTQGGAKSGVVEGNGEFAPDNILETLSVSAGEREA